jgi:hypothetical protein
MDPTVFFFLAAGAIIWWIPTHRFVIRAGLSKGKGLFAYLVGGCLGVATGIFLMVALGFQLSIA